MDPSAVSPFPIAARRLPGYGVPLDHYAKDENNKGFDHPLLSTRGAGPILPVREYEMMEFMNRVTDKVEWEEKVYKDEIVEEWRRENVDEQGGEEGGDRDFSLEMFEWVSVFFLFFFPFFFGSYNFWNISFLAFLFP